MSNNVSFLLNEALSQHQSGNFTRAKILYRKIIKLDSDNVNALQLLAAIEIQELDYGRAINLLNRAISLAPQYSDFYYNRGIALSALNKNNDAINDFHKSLELDPSSHNAHMNLGNIYFKLNRFGEAHESYLKVISLQPSYPAPYYNLGNLCLTINNLKDAEEFFQKAIELNPRYIEALIGLACLYLRQKNYIKAKNILDIASEINPKIAEIHYNYANIALESRHYDEAIKAYNNAIRIKNNYPEAYCNMGICFHIKGEYQEAINNYNLAIKLNPNYIKAIQNKAETLFAIKEYGESLRAYDLAYSLEKTKLNNSGYIFSYNSSDEYVTENEFENRKKFEEVSYISGRRQQIKLHLCDWTDYQSDVTEISKAVDSGRLVCEPLILNYMSDDLKILRRNTELFVDANFLNIERELLDSRVNNDKIKIGYYSSDFCDHPVFHLIFDALKLHDQNKFEIHIFSLLNHEDDVYHHELKKKFSNIHYCADKSDYEIAKLSRNINLDIAIDLMGYTRNARTSIFAHGAARIQINFLGYPGTMGAKFIDYIIADRVTIPDEASKFYSEKILYLTDCFMPTPKRPVIQNNSIERKVLGISPKSIVFCSLNNFSKLTPKMFENWMKILSSIENSILMLPSHDMIVKENLKNSFKKYQISENRILFLDYVKNREEYLSRLSCADIFLDSFPYNAHATAVDVLMSAVPIVTMMGNSFSSRVASSLLTALDLRELIAGDEDDYTNIAIRLASDNIYRDQIKNKLINNIDQKKLFKPDEYIKNLENLFQQLSEN